MPFVLIIGIGVVLTAFVSYAQSVLAHSNNTGLLGWLANAAAKIPIFGGLSASQVLKLDAWITHQLGAHFKQVEHRAVGWIAGLSTYVKLMALAPMNIAATLWSLAWWLVHSEIPRQSKANVQHAESVATHADAVAETALKKSVGLAKSHPGAVSAAQVTRIQTVAMPHAAEWDWINKHWAALKTAVLTPAILPGVIGLPVGVKWFGLTRRQLRWHSRRISRLEKLLGVGVFAATMAKVLGVSARCLGRNGNVGKVARGLCGLPTHLLNDLLGILADVWILENVCILLPFLETAAADIGAPLVSALTDVTAGLCKGSIGAAKPLQGPMPVVPPVTYGISLVAV